MKRISFVFLALIGCARGPTDLDAGFRTGIEPVDGPDAGSPRPIENPDRDGGSVATVPDASTPRADGGRQSDAGDAPDEDAATPCAAEPVSCPEARDAGLVLSDVDGPALTLEGMGPAFVRVLAKDGQASGNAVGGLRATLTSAANYDLVVYGQDTDACAELGFASEQPAGLPDELAPAWGTNGPFVTIDRVLTFEVRRADASCGAPWTLVLAGNPCPAFTLEVGPMCP